MNDSLKCQDYANTTFFASPERSSKEELAIQSQNFMNSWDKVQDTYDTTPQILLILNEHRQIVFVNKALCALLGIKGEMIVGQRPGEALGCIYADEGPNGCGTSEHCRYCGAVTSILAGLEGKGDSQICQILTKDNGTIDLRVFSQPKIFNDQHYCILWASDITDELCKNQFEQVFFHNILNQTGSLAGLLELINDQDISEKNKEIVQLISTGMNNLILEIQSQREFMEAENGKLKTNFHQMPIHSFCEELVNRILLLPEAKDKKIILNVNPPNFNFENDYQLLSRVFVNLLKNALEAEPANSEIHMNVSLKENTIKFEIVNQTVIPEHVQLQIFKRSFSTKSCERGLGCYMARLLLLRYLNGRIEFISNKEKGTCFSVYLQQNGL